MVLVKSEREYYNVPKYPDFPYNEYKSRIDKAQKLMVENNVDCLVLWNRKNIRYFFGFQTIHWYLESIQPAVTVIPAAGEPILIVPALLLGNAEGLTWAKDIRYQLEPHQPINERNLPKEVANVVKEVGCGDKNIGFEKGPLGCMSIPRPLNDIEALRNALPDAKVVDGDKVIWGCRMIKSPLEIDRIRKAVNTTAKIQASIVEGYKPGMTEVELGRIIHRTAAEQEGSHLGDDGLAVIAHFICSLEKEPMADIMALEGVTINKDDYIQIDMAYTYKGYCPDSARVFQIGPITDRIKKNYELIWKGEDQAAEILKPGVKAKELFEAMYEPIKSAGIQPLDMGGHGTGLETHEPPSIDAWNEMTVDEGMVLSIEPWIFTSLKSRGGEGLYGIQDTYVVTSKGYEKIEGLRRDIIQVSHTIS